MADAARVVPPNGRWVRVYQPAPTAGLRLVCFPHAGGSASFFRPLGRLLSPELETLAIQYPGRQDRRDEAVIEGIPELADRLSGALGPWLDRPTAFFGHSMGATVAYEVAARLRESAQEPVCLVVSGRRAPSRRRDDPWVHLLDDDGLLAEVRALSGTENQVLADRDLMRLTLPALRGDYKAVETYEPAPGLLLGCPVLAVIGDDDPKVTVTEAAAWAEHTSGGFRLRTLPGGHFYLNNQLPAIATLIRQHVRASVHR